MMTWISSSFSKGEGLNSGCKLRLSMVIIASDYDSLAQLLGKASKESENLSLLETPIKISRIATPK